MVMTERGSLRGSNRAAEVVTISITKGEIEEAWRSIKIIQEGEIQLHAAVRFARARRVPETGQAHQDGALSITKGAANLLVFLERLKSDGTAVETVGVARGAA